MNYADVTRQKSHISCQSNISRASCLSKQERDKLIAEKEVEIEQRGINLIKAGSILAIIYTCCYYVINDLRKKKR